LDQGGGTSIHGKKPSEEGGNSTYWKHGGEKKKETKQLGAPRPPAKRGTSYDLKGELTRLRLKNKKKGEI